MMPSAMPMRTPAVSRSGTVSARGSSASKATMASATVRVRKPAVSSVRLKGTMPSVDQRPAVVLRPTVPVHAAGMRTLPAVSVPKARAALPSIRLTPAPALEPPGTRCSFGSHGLRGVPRGFVPMPPKASSTVRVLPVGTASMSRVRRTTGPASSKRLGSCTAVPPVVGKPGTP